MRILRQCHKIFTNTVRSGQSHLPTSSQSDTPGNPATDKKARWPTISGHGHHSGDHLITQTLPTKGVRIETNSFVESQTYTGYHDFQSFWGQKEREHHMGYFPIVWTSTIPSTTLFGSTKSQNNTETTETQTASDAYRGKLEAERDDICGFTTSQLPSDGRSDQVTAWHVLARLVKRNPSKSGEHRVIAPSRTAISSATLYSTRTDHFDLKTNKVGSRGGCS